MSRGRRINHELEAKIAKLCADGLSYKQIEERMGMSANAARCVVFRMKKRECEARMLDLAARCGGVGLV